MLPRRVGTRRGEADYMVPLGGSEPFPLLNVRCVVRDCDELVGSGNRKSYGNFHSRLHATMQASERFRFFQ